MRIVDTTPCDTPPSDGCLSRPVTACTSALVSSVLVCGAFPEGVAWRRAERGGEAPGGACKRPGGVVLRKGGGVALVVDGAGPGGGPGGVAWRTWGGNVVGLC